MTYSSVLPLKVAVPACTKSAELWALELPARQRKGAHKAQSLPRVYTQLKAEEEGQIDIFS